MPKAEENQVFFELTQYSLHALRVVNGSIEAGGECLLENKPALEALLDAVAPNRKTEGLKAASAVWPNSAGWHVSTDTEAMLDRTAEALRAIASVDKKDPFLYSVCNAGDGGKVTADGTDKWVLAHCSREAQQKVTATLKGFNSGADGASPAAFAAIGAIAAALKLEGKDGAVTLWDLGSERSSLILVTPRGVEAVAPCSIGMESIFEAVQSALKLKFRGAGARLFFNEGYDFTEPGPKVGATIGVGLKEALANLPVQAIPPGLACLGLTSRQSWFIRESAAAAGLVQWTPEPGKLASHLGLKFSDEAVAAALSATSVGLLGFVSMRMNAREEWSPVWVEVEAPLEAEEAPVAEPEEEPQAEPDPEPIVRPVVSTIRPKPSLSTEHASGPQVTFSTKPSRPPVPPRSMTSPPVPSQAPLPGSTRPPIPAPAVRQASPSPLSAPPSFPASAPGGRPPSFSNPGFPMPGGSVPEPPASVRPPSFSNPGFPVPKALAHAPADPVAPQPISSAAGKGPNTGEQSAKPLPIPAVTALPFEAIKLKPVAGAGAVPKAPPKSRVGFYITLGVVASLVFAAIALVVEARLEKIKAYDLEQQEALAHHKAEEQLKEAEQNAKDEAERNRKDNEAAVQLARKQAEEQTRREVLAEVEAERQSKLPGSLLVATVPAGASLSVDGGAPLKTPVKIDGLQPGNHRVQITLPGHDPVDVNTEIRGSKTTDLGSIPLQSSFGAIEISSSPDGLEFAIRTADDPKGKPVRTGRTPATFEDLAHGGYIVTFSRAGCLDHTEAVSVEKGARSAVATKYQDGSLELTSEPSGASVSKDGTFLGTTPLALHSLTPKLATFDLTLPGYDPTPISCQIPEGDTLKYSAQLLRKDRIFTATEVKTPPESYEAPAPVLSPSQRKMGADVLLSLVVRRDGTAAEIEIVHATDDDIARRCKNAVEKWKFHPATAPDDRTVVARIELPFKFPAGAK